MARQLISTGLIWFCAGLMCGLFLLLSGCSLFDGENKASGKQNNRSGDNKNSIFDKLVGNSKPDIRPNTSYSPKLRWDGGGVILGDTDSAIFTADSFVAAISDLADEQRFSTIQHLVRKYPDVALKALQEFNPAIHNLNSMTLIADSFQKQWGVTSGDRSAGWVAYVAEAGNHQEVFRNKTKFWEHLKKHQSQEALALGLTKSLASSSNAALEAECFRLEAIALMLDSKYQKAIEKQKKSISAMQAQCPYQTQHAMLLLGEFYRHSGQLEKWKSTWQQATVEQSMLVAERSLVDPSFWNRAAFLRPAGIDWPEQVVQNMKGYLAWKDFSGMSNDESNNVALSDDGVIWLTIGLQHLSRGEGQNAILALKKSESATNGSRGKDQLRLHQARAMILAAQPGAASAILIRMISDNEGEVIADRAKAVLGALKLQNGAISQGFNLIQASLPTVEAWPRDERMRAQADYALALLVKGYESRALPILEKVQKEFVSLGEIDQAHQCLWNKAVYFEKTEQKEQHVKALNELTDFERL